MEAVPGMLDMKTGEPYVAAQPGWTWAKVERVDALFRRLQSINEIRSNIVAGNAIPQCLPSYNERVEICATTYRAIQELLLADIDRLRMELRATLEADGAEVDG